MSTMVVTLFWITLVIAGALSNNDFCDSKKCKSPDCFCSGSLPNSVPLKERPQFVFLTFDDAFSNLAMNSFYSKIFEGPNALKNPNGQPIRATHFMTHLYSSYPDAHKYYSKLGHEMASHSITHLSNTTYWKTLTSKQWIDEMYGMKQMMNLYGGISMSDIKGLRTPFLQGGGDTQYDAIFGKFVYDCSMPTQTFGYVNMANGLWPYTLDNQTIQDCVVPPCPRKSYPGFWIQPMLELEDLRIGVNPKYPDSGQPCSMFDACVIPDDKGQDPELVYDMLMTSFNRSYYGNTRAPFGVYLHAAWFFGQQWHYDGYYKFLQHITEMDDVWILPISAGIEYMKNPIPNSEMKNVEPFKSDPSTFPAFNCSSVQHCRYTDVKYPNFKINEIYLSICGTKCPSEYPWLNNVEGKSPPS